MQERGRTIRLETLLSAIIVYLTAGGALGTIIHNDDQPTARPSDAVIGRWEKSDTNYATCVAISPYHVVTVRHFGGTVGNKVVIGGVEYTAAEIFLPQGSQANADMCIARLETAGGQQAYLNDYVGIYAATDEVGKEVVLGGAGKIRGADLTSSHGVYGYQWAKNLAEVPVWGTNRVDAATDNYNQISPYISDVLRADFDETGTAYEASVAGRDSGGGWFVNDAGTWKLVAMTGYAEAHGVGNEEQTWFRNPTTGALDPDKFWGIRISSYSEWVGQTIPEPATCTLLAIGMAGWAAVSRRRTGI